MSSVPLSYKAKNLTVSTFPKPASTTAFSSTFPASDRGFVTTAVMKKSTVELDEALRDIKRRYEDEARNVQTNYEADYNNHLSLVKAIEELEILLDDERRRSFEFENKYNVTVLELEKERRLRIDFEHDIAVLKDEVRRSQAIISENELIISRLHQDVSHLDAENKSLRAEIHRLTDLYNDKIRNVEDKYILEVKDASAEIERLRSNLDQQRADYETRLRELDREWNVKYTRQEDRLRDKERLIAELESELRKLTAHIAQLKIEYEEEMRRQVILVREEELHKYQLALKNPEAKIHQLESERELLMRKNQELIRDLHLKERQIQDLKMNFDVEVSRLRQEINDLRNQISLLSSNNDKLRGEVAVRDTNIGRLESEIVNLEREIERIKDIHTQELNRLVNDQSNERRRVDENERLLKARIAELERVQRAFEGENVKLRTDLERLKDQITGNIHKTIFQTFVDYEGS